MKIKISIKSNTYVCSLALLPVALLLPVPARAVVEVSETPDLYSIRGNTANDLRREMSAKGPAGSGGRRFDGYTRWHINWQYRYRQRGGLCTIDSVQTKVSVTMTLPVWQNDRDGDADTRAKWHRYREALVLHENGHRQHGLSAAQDVDRAILNLPGEPNCDALGAKANAEALAIIRRYNQRDLAYDRDTRHGATQGARFP